MAFKDGIFFMCFVLAFKDVQLTAAIAVRDTTAASAPADPHIARTARTNAVDSLLDELRIADQSAGEPACAKVECPHKFHNTAAWTQLFGAWNGKRILLAGDSVIRQFFEVLECGSRALGGSFERSRVANVLWDSPFVMNTTGEPCVIDRPTTDFSGIQGRVSRVVVKTREHEFAVDLFFHYFMTDSCRAHCGGEAESEGCSLCADNIGDIATADGLAKWASGYDHAYVNMGHEVYIPSRDPGAKERLIQKTQALADAANRRGASAKMVFVEHPPQHFKDAERTGNYPGKLLMGRGVCTCDIANIDQQDVAINNREISSKMLQNGIKVARIWEILRTTGCKMHGNHGDCTHFAHWQGKVWEHVAASFAQAIL